MTENSDSYENAITERINGILKQEFSIGTYHLELPLNEENSSRSYLYLQSR